MLAPSPHHRFPEFCRATPCLFTSQVLQLPSISLVDGVYTERQLRRGETSKPRYDPAEARRLLDASGWRQRGLGDGLLERRGQDFRFTALTEVGTRATDAALYAQDQLRDLGVRMELQPLERGVLQSRLKAREFEAAVCNSSIAGALGGRLRGFFGEQSSSYSNPQLTRLFDRLATIADPDVADEIHREISDLLRRDQASAATHGAGRDRAARQAARPWDADPPPRLYSTG
jgi:ABC-type transport system substrate-binding protein